MSYSFDNLKTQVLLEALTETLGALGNFARESILGYMQVTNRECLSKDCISISEVEAILRPVLGEGATLIIEQTKKRLDLLAKSGIIIDC